MPSPLVNNTSSNMLTARPTASGNYEVFEDGKRISTTTLDQAKQMGASIEGLPSMQTTATQTNALPQQQGSLLNFQDSLSKAVNLAKQKRNEMSLSFMAPFAGTVAAGDFGSILSSLNNASDTYSGNLGKSVLESQGLDRKPIQSGALNLSPEETNELYGILKTGRTQSGTVYGNPTGEDGFTDPAVYLKVLDTWRQNQGLVEDFLKYFPVETFINPANKWVGEQLKQRGVKFGKESEGSGDYSPTEKRKLEQAGLLNASRQEQLDYLYGEEEDDYAGL